MSKINYVIDLTSPSQTVQINLSQEYLYDFRLVEYSATGLVNTLPLYVRFLNQPMNAIYGNLPATSLPLLWTGFPNSAVFLSNPLPVCLGMHFNGSHQLQIRVEDINQQPAQFTRLILIFQADLDDPVQKWKMTNLEKSLRQG